MTKNILRFDVTGLDVTVPESFHLEWQGREIDSGAVNVTLGEPGSGGMIDYVTGRVNVEFRVKISFPELAEALSDMGAEADSPPPLMPSFARRGWYSMVTACASPARDGRRAPAVRPQRKIPTFVIPPK